MIIIESVNSLHESFTQNCVFACLQSQALDEEAKMTSFGFLNDGISSFELKRLCISQE